ncbi:hypothetical protein DPMN_077155 [Dreissena polymorpha]|uniref:Uncharacterized protein n=1 Tax=Dreissena polymorpha TaxID=45954 RepID=A0A9D4BGD9_DREPO|nr:hypothetical protein DPMN_077155 [Dreissena polymorpha]
MSERDQDVTIDVVQSSLSSSLSPTYVTSPVTSNHVKPTLVTSASEPLVASTVETSDASRVEAEISIGEFHGQSIHSATFLTPESHVDSFAEFETCDATPSSAQRDTHLISAVPFSSSPYIASNKDDNVNSDLNIHELHIVNRAKLITRGATPCDVESVSSVLPDSCLVKKTGNTDLKCGANALKPVYSVNTIGIISDILETGLGNFNLLGDDHCDKYFETHYDHLLSQDRHNEANKLNGDIFTNNSNLNACPNEYTDSNIQDSLTPTDDKLHSRSAGSEAVKLTRHTIEMGNKQHTAVKNVHSDDNSPDETKTKCCEIPKRKLKDRNAPNNRSSRNDDLSFASNEVYPFERRSHADQELNEQVELEPFDIVDTDDIRFVPGAGTSDVIKSVSDPRFTTIPDSPEQIPSTSQLANEETQAQRRFYIDKGDRLLQPGTSTAHSTFEFKGVKERGKTKYIGNIEERPHSEHFKEETVALGVSGINCAPANSKPGNISIEGYRQLSKDAVPIPVRRNNKDEKAGKRLSKPNPDQDQEFSESPTTINVTENASIRHSEVVRNIDNVLMLTQTMFSKKTDFEEITTEKTSNNNKSAELVKCEYENVNVGVKLEASGLSITHKDNQKKSEHKLKYDSHENNDRIKEAIVVTKGLPSEEKDIAKGTRYENIGRCVKLEKSGISITHKPDNTQPQKIIEKKAKEPPHIKNEAQLRRERKTSDDKELVAIRQDKVILDNNNVKEQLRKPNSTSQAEVRKCRSEYKRIRKSADKEFVELQQEGKYNDGILHISDSGTLIIKSLPKPPSHAPSSEPGENHYYENDFIDKEQTDIKVPMENTYEETTCIPFSNIENDKEKEKMKKSQNDKTDDSESVPPPSPLRMECFEEEDEYMEENEEIFDEDKKRRSLEMFEFTEHICKRLSQLLENSQTVSENDGNEDYLFESGRYPKSNATEQSYRTGNVHEEINDDDYNKNTLDNESKRLLKAGLDMSEETSLTRPVRNESSSTLKRTSGDSDIFKDMANDGEDDGMPEYFDPRENTIKPIISNERLVRENDTNSFASMRYDNISFEDTLTSVSTLDASSFSSDNKSGQMQVTPNDSNVNYDNVTPTGTVNEAMTLPLRAIESGIVIKSSSTTVFDDPCDYTPTGESHSKFTALTEMTTAKQVDALLQFETSGRQSVTCTESDLDTSEHRDDMSTDSMLADDEDEETMEILFTKKYTEPIEGNEVFLSCTVVNSSFKDSPVDKGKRDSKKKSDTWLSDDALEYFEANASEVMSTAFLKAKKEMKDIQMCLQGLRRQMEHFHSDAEDKAHPDFDYLSPDYFGLPRKAITD